MFGLGTLIAKRRWGVIAVSLVVAVVGVIGAGTLGALSLNRFEAPGSESMEAKEVLGREFGAGSPNIGAPASPPRAKETCVSQSSRRSVLRA